MAKTPNEIVELVERELAEWRPCPFCQMYNSHAADCAYLFHKGNVDAGNEKSETKATVQTSEVSADVADESKAVASTEELLDKMKKK